MKNILLFICLFVAGCEEQQPQGTIISTDLVDSTNKTTTTTLPDGARLIIIASSERYYRDIDVDIRKQLQSVMNSGRYHVIKVNTIYSSLDGHKYLSGAEVYFK